MPIELNGAGEGSPTVKPSTNAHELFSVLEKHPEMGFSPSELAELTEVPQSSLQKTLSRFQKKGLVRKVDSFWALEEDIASSRIASAVSLQQIEAEYGNDAYGESDDWAETAPDLRENA